MGMINDIKHCLLVMIDCELCEECNLYGTTGTDHCEHDCVYGALDIIDKYQRIEEVINRLKNINDHTTSIDLLLEIKEIIEDGNDD